MTLPEPSGVKPTEVEPVISAPTVREPLEPEALLNATAVPERAPAVVRLPFALIPRVVPAVIEPVVALPPAERLKLEPAEELPRATEPVSVSKTLPVPPVLAVRLEALVLPMEMFPEPEETVRAGVLISPAV